MHLIGMVKREDLPKYYTMVQVCVSASRFETQGLSLMEAMACRVPIVVPNVRAFKEIIIDNENGFLFDGGIEDMAKRIVEALDASRDDRIRDAAMERAKSYSEDSSARKLVELYESVIEHFVDPRVDSCVQFGPRARKSYFYYLERPGLDTLRAERRIRLACCIVYLKGVHYAPYVFLVGLFVILRVYYPQFAHE